MHFRLRSAVVGCLTGCLAGTVSAEPPAKPEPPIIYVQLRENLSGFKGDELANFLARTMTRADEGPWRFNIAQSGRPQPQDRIEWTFIPSTAAAGSVRTYGFSRAMMERLFGSKRVFTIEARLYLHGEYQALASGQFSQTDDPQNAELTEEIGILVRNLMATPGIIDNMAHPDPSARSTHQSM